MAVMQEKGDFIFYKFSRGDLSLRDYHSKGYLFDLIKWSLFRRLWLGVLGRIPVHMGLHGGEQKYLLQKRQYINISEVLISNLRRRKIEMILYCNCGSIFAHPPPRMAVTDMQF